MLWEAVVVTVAAWYIYLQSLAKKCQIHHHFFFASCSCLQVMSQAFLAAHAVMLLD